MDLGRPVLHHFSLGLADGEAHQVLVEAEADQPEMAGLLLAHEVAGAALAPPHLTAAHLDASVAGHREQPAEVESLVGVRVGLVLGGNPEPGQVVVVVASVVGRYRWGHEIVLYHDQGICLIGKHWIL